MSLFSRSILVTLLLGSSVVWAQTQTPVPVEAFARYNTISMPRLSPDGQYLALTSDLGKGHYALNVFRLDDNVQTTQMRLSPTEYHRIQSIIGHNPSFTYVCKERIITLKIYLRLGNC